MASQYFRQLFNLVFAIGCLFPFGVVASQDAATKSVVTLSVVPEREDGKYKVGEEGNFVVSVSGNNEAVLKGKVTYSVDDFLSGRGFPNGKLDLNGNRKIPVTLANPGFLRCRVSWKNPDGQVLNATAGIGFSPREIQPSLKVPDDFDAFWTKQKIELAKVALEPKLEPVEQSNKRVQAFDIKVPCIGEMPVSGYFTKPSKVKAKSHPAILWVHGAGVRSASLGNSVKGAMSGMLSLDINAHGIKNGQPAGYYTKLSRGQLRSYRTDGRNSRDEIYFRGMFLRVIRAIDFLTSQPEWDGQHLIVIGHSQGGGQSLAAGGLDPRVSFIAAGVPAICDHTGMAVGRVSGWPKLVRMDKDGKPEKLSLQTARYFDGVNFASRYKRDAIMSVGFVDATCPPSSCYAAFNQISGEKEMLTRPLMGHAAPQDIQDAFFDRILRHVDK